MHIYYKLCLKILVDMFKNRCYDKAVNKSKTKTTEFTRQPRLTRNSGAEGGKTMNGMLYGGLAGIAAGLAFNRVAVFQVKRRTEDSAKREAVDNVALAIISAVISGILFALIFKLYGSTPKRIEYAAYISIAISIGVVDLDLKKIPNLSVLALLAVRTAAAVYELISGGSAKGAIFPSLIGLAAAFILYQLPMLIGIPIGTGDVKFAAAIGYCLGLTGFLEAAIIMAIGLALLLALLKVTKKGNLKTKVPMGPFLALGTAATIIFPVFTGLSQQIFSL